MMAHPEPKKVCIIGGGDGAVLTELCKYDCVEEVRRCIEHQLGSFRVCDHISVIYRSPYVRLMRW